MQQLVHGPWRRMAKPLACVLAVLALVFLLQVTPHGHENGQDEAACLLCQAAHVSATPVLSGIAISVPFVMIGEVTAPKISAASESFFRHSDPRAPPAEVLH